jgi:cell division protein FtsB
MVAKKIKGDLNIVRNYISCHPSNNELVKQADRKFGEYESYIRELLEENTQLKQQINLLRSQHKQDFLTVATEIKSQELYQTQKTLMHKYCAEIKGLKKRNEELVYKIALLNKEKLGI